MKPNKKDTKVSLIAEGILGAVDSGVWPYKESQTQLPADEPVRERWPGRLSGRQMDTWSSVCMNDEYKRDIKV